MSSNLNILKDIKAIFNHIYSYFCTFVVYINQLLWLYYTI